MKRSINIKKTLEYLQRQREKYGSSVELHIGVEGYIDVIYETPRCRDIEYITSFSCLEEFAEEIEK